jgi:hypothetical protein
VDADHRIRQGSSRSAVPLIGQEGAWRDHDADVGGPWRLVVAALSYAGQLNITEVADRDGCPTCRYSPTVCRTPPMSCRPNLNREPRPCLTRTVASLARRPQFVIELSVLPVADHRPVADVSRGVQRRQRGRRWSSWPKSALQRKLPTRLQAVLTRKAHRKPAPVGPATSGTCPHFGGTSSRCSQRW